MRVVRVALAATALVSILGLRAGPAEAHASLQSTSPDNDTLLDQVPAAVELRFSESVEVVEGGIRVIGPDGERTGSDSDDRSESGALLSVPVDSDQEGTYTVAWRVLSEDGHNISGSFVFHVGVRTGAASVDDDDAAADLTAGIGRWSGFAGTLMAIGAATVALLAPRERRIRRPLRLLAMGGAALATVGVALVLLAQAATSSGSGLLAASGTLVELAGGTRTGVFGLARAGLLAVAVALALAAPLWNRAPWLAAAPVAGSMVLLSLSGHAWTVDDRGIAVVIDLVHLGAVSVWAGGLVALTISLPLATDRAGLARRFSATALVTVVIVAISGTVSGWMQLRTLDALTGTGYGQLLLTKVAGFVVLVGFGWLNRHRLLPRMSAALNGLLRSMRAEVAVAAVILVLTAALVNQPPPRDREVVLLPFEAKVQAEDAQAVLEVMVDPARLGVNDFHLHFYQEDGITPLPVDAVEIAVAVDDIPPRRLVVTPVLPNHVSALDASLTAPGTWTVQVTAVRAAEPLNFTFEVPIN